MTDCLESYTESVTVIYLRDFVSRRFFDNCEFVSVVSKVIFCRELNEFIKDNYRIAFRSHSLIRILLVAR